MFLVYQGKKLKRIDKLMIAHFSCFSAQDSANTLKEFGGYLVFFTEFEQEKQMDTNIFKNVTRTSAEVRYYHKTQFDLIFCHAPFSM